MIVVQSCCSDNYVYECKFNGNDVEEGLVVEFGSGCQFFIWGDRIDFIVEEEVEQ